MNVSRTETSSLQNFGKLPSFQTVVDGRLIRGRAVTCPATLYQMKQEGVSQIIDLRNTSAIKRPLEKFFCKLLGIKYLNYRYPFRHSTLPDDTFFKRLNNDIIQNEGKTYLHCAKGKRRTGVCTAVYQKFHSEKSESEIIQNMLELGFHEVLENKQSPKARKVKAIYNNLLERYFPKLKCFDGIA